MGPSTVPTSKAHREILPPRPRSLGLSTFLPYSRDSPSVNRIQSSSSPSPRRLSIVESYFSRPTNICCSYVSLSFFFPAFPTSQTSIPCVLSSPFPFDTTTRLDMLIPCFPDLDFSLDAFPPLLSFEKVRPHTPFPQPSLHRNLYTLQYRTFPCPTSHYSSRPIDHLGFIPPAYTLN